ncbi:helix-turn-helix domain-containing protein [Pelagicoccus sp. SDUM812005]|uniref:hybrid sensor histidine kinase/response regulator transcription factor n=1 Tax=Pelagicoccus sp. SDUM812005 TaxID=3041257 RepID=UPI00280C75EF|nr:helix-turn-helix domain-containing protein [Pelagicoccus sp. SDUM812005]MDQ8179582.1 helix-turn-helix domain-containing protein [Pelagicoccus sp. SDUM812005]
MKVLFAYLDCMRRKRGILKGTGLSLRGQAWGLFPWGAYHFRLVLGCALLCFASFLEGAQAYSPSESEVIGDAWRWSEIEGLGDGFIRCFDLAEDGSVWIGKEGLVQRYDGSSVEEFGVFSSPPSTLGAVKQCASGEVYLMAHQELYRLQQGEWVQIAGDGPFEGHRLQEGQDGRVWLASRGRILSVAGDELVRSERLARRILDIAFDRSGDLWVLAEEGSVFRCEVEAGTAIARQEWVGDTSHLRAKAGMIEVASDGRVWVVDSLLRRLPQVFAPETGRWQEIDLRRFGGTNVNYAIWESRPGRMLISGAESIVYQSGDDWHSVPNIDLDKGLPVTSMSSGKDGALWCLQSSRLKSRSRLSRIDYAGERWKAYQGLNYQCDLGDGRHCFLTQSGELVVQDAKGGDWKLYDESDGLIDNPVVALRDRNDELWVAGSHGGQAAVNHFDGEAWELLELPELGRFVSRFAAKALSDGSLAFGYGQARRHWKGAGGIVRIRLEAGRYVKERLENLEYNRIVSIEEAENGDLLYSKNRIYRYANGESSPLDVPLKGAGSWIDEFHPQGQDKLWYCSWGQGVHYYDGREWQVFTESEGLSSDFVSNLLVLEDGKVLALTAKGLDRFVDGEWHAVAGPPLEGIREGSTLRQSADGTVWVNQAAPSWFVTRDSRMEPGLDFACWRFRADEQAPQTQASFFVEPTKYSDAAYIVWEGRDPWSETAQSALQYSYRLDDGEWSPYGSETSTYLSGLSPGDHFFRVRARDQDRNVDTSPAVLVFSVVFPFWESAWFKVAAVAFPLAVVGFVILLVAQKFRHMAELDGVRTRFLMNISHELRSPLSLIMMPLEKLKKQGGDGDRSHDLATAIRSTQRLNQLVDQLLDLHKARALKYKLNPKTGDIVGYTRAIVSDFGNLAEGRGQQVRFSSNEEEYVTRFDEDIYRKIMDNLVLNAIKHSPANAEISVSLQVGDAAETLRLVVEDNGEGIRPRALKRIFEPFYHDAKESGERMRSFGIGLALVKELVEFCQGSIVGESPIRHDAAGRGYGARFTVELAGMPRCEERQTEARGQAPAPSDPKRHLGASPVVATKGEGGKPSVLLVDDHDELRQYLARELAADFAVLEAGSGREGIELAVQRMPDIIVADVIMPEMSGVDFCDALKKKVATSHIPIILQTSLASDESEAAGLEAGAIDYVAKPTSVSLLKRRIYSHLDARRRFAKHLRTQLLEPDEPLDSGGGENDAEVEFVRKIQSLLERNWDKAEFNADKLASEMGMGRSSFYDKCKAITNTSPAEAIKAYRLAKAKELLLQGKSVAQVAEWVGYFETRSFYRAFKKRFNCTPSEFQKAAKV